MDQKQAAKHEIGWKPVEKSPAVEMQSIFVAHRPTHG